MNTHLKRLDEIITESFLSTLMESILPDYERNLYSLQIRDGGIWTPNLQQCASMTAPLFAIMINQGNILADNTFVAEAKPNSIKLNQPALIQKSKTKKNCQGKRWREKGVSSWFFVLPLEEFVSIWTKEML